MKNTGKFLMVVFLMCLAIYQAGELWFEDFSSHNFFWFGNFSSSFDAKDVGYITDRLIVNLGDGKVVCKQSDIYNKSIKRILILLLERLCPEGTLWDSRSWIGTLF